MTYIGQIFSKWRPCEFETIHGMLYIVRVAFLALYLLYMALSSKTYSKGDICKNIKVKPEYRQNVSFRPGLPSGFSIDIHTRFIPF